MPPDYRNFQGFKDAGRLGPIEHDRKWWTLSKDEMPSAINGVTKFLHDHQSRRETQNLISARLYGNLSIMGLNGLTYSKVASVQNSLKERISYNVCQSVVDTLAAKIAKNKPKPLFLTSGADYKLQRKAKKLDKFTEGIFYENEAYKLGPRVFRDSCIFDAGLVHVFNHFGRVKYERVIPMEIYVDEVEAFYGEPRQLHWVKNVDRAVLIDMFPEKKAKILATASATPDNLGGYENVSDVVTVRGSWHLPSGPDAKDGMHVITTISDLLDSYDWNKPYFPFAFLKYSDRQFGFWGQGLVEQIQNIQLEINKLLWVVQRSMHLAGSFKLLLENSSKIIKEHLNNDIGAIITYTGQPPTYVTPPIVQPEVYQHLLTLKNAAYEQAGISQLSAASQKPAGLNSGKALREYNDIETDRFMVTGQAYERFFLDLAKLTIATAEDIYADTKEYKVKVPGKKFIETIDWKDVDLDEDEYVMKLYPVSSLPSTPEGRLQTVQEFAQAGFISPRTARKLLDFPDLEQVEDLANSQEDYLHEILEKIVEEGIYTAPEPYDDLQLAQELALEYYSQGKCAGLEEEKLDLLRQFIDQINEMKSAAQAAALQQAQAMQAAQNPPQAQPQPAPQSDLIPNVPGVQ